MGVTNPALGTRVDEIATGIYRISTPAREAPGGFSFNQYLIVEDQPLLFHTGSRRLLPLVEQAISSIMPVADLRYLAFSHFESDECGALNELLTLAPEAQPVCGQINAMINRDSFDRAPRVLTDGEVLTVGTHRLRWLDAPHLPHAWDCGYLNEEHTRTLLCGDLFTQGGSDNPPLVTGDILGPSEAFRRVMDYYSHTRHARALLDRLASTGPQTLACMHGSAWQGDGARLLGELAVSLES